MTYNPRTPSAVDLAQNALRVYESGYSRSHADFDGQGVTDLAERMHFDPSKRLSDGARLIRKLKSRAVSAYARYFTHATLVEGTLTGDTVSSRCLFAMKGDSPVENYLLERMYGGSCRRVRIETVWVPQLEAHARTPPYGADFCISVLPACWDSTFAGLADIVSPSIVHQKVDISGDWGDLKKRFLESRRKSVLSKFLRDTRFSTRISTNPQDLDHFYHRMYLPHIRRQFMTAVSVDPIEKLQRSFSVGFVLMISDGGQDVAGALCLIRGDSMCFFRGGVLDGDEQHVRNGAQTAMYVSMLRYAKEQNVRFLDFGHSRPFFNDGVYRYKRSWGASVEVDDDLENWIYIFDPKGSPRLAHFLQQHPLIARGRNGLMALGAAPAGEVTTDMRKRLESLYYSPGLRGMILRPAGGAQPAAFDFQSSALQ
jgi:hypothetical protein